MRGVMNRQAGLTLVELMVATTLSLVLLAGVMLVFSANKTTHKMQSGLGTLQENGRYAMRQITADLQMAGFGGCLSPNLDPKPRIINLVASSPTYLDDFAGGQFFDGEDNNIATYDSKAMVASTDSIEIRGPLRSDVNYVVGETVAPNPVVVKNAVTISAAPYFVISDCGGADIFAAANTAGSTTSTLTRTSGNTQTALSRGFNSDAMVAGLARHTYFVADTGRLNSAGDAVTALYRFDGTTAVELVDGVEDLQLEYALDTSGDGRADTFRGVSAGGSGTAMGTGDWPQVVAVRISLLMSSVDPATDVLAPYTYFQVQSTPISPVTGDRLLRQEFSSLVYVRNAVQ